MKTLDEYMQLPYRMEIVPDMNEGGFAISFPDLPGCVTCADTLDEAFANATEAKKSVVRSSTGGGAFDTGAKRAGRLFGTV